MALLLKNGAVFLHIPKTGGTWVGSVLRELDLVRCPVSHFHADADRLFLPGFKRGKIARPDLLRQRKKYLNTRTKPFMFSFVRHPLSWYESWFKYMSMAVKSWRAHGAEIDLKGRTWHPNAALNELGSSDFNTFVRNVVRARPGYVTEMFGWYTKGADFVGKQENLADDLYRALDTMGLIEGDGAEIRGRSRVNASETPKIPIEWDPALRREVERLEYAGIVRYGYEATDCWDGSGAAVGTGDAGKGF